MSVAFSLALDAASRHVMGAHNSGRGGGQLSDNNESGNVVENAHRGLSLWWERGQVEGRTGCEVSSSRGQEVVCRCARHQEQTTLCPLALLGWFQLDEKSPGRAAQRCMLPPCRPAPLPPFLPSNDTAVCPCPWTLSVPHPVPCSLPVPGLLDPSRHAARSLRQNLTP